MTSTRSILSDRYSRLSNVHAALLDIAMLNTFSDLPDLRGAAYDLIRAVCSSMNFDTESWLPSSGEKHYFSQSLSIPDSFHRRIHSRCSSENNQRHQFKDRGFRTGVDVGLHLPGLFAIREAVRERDEGLLSTLHESVDQEL